MRRLTLVALALAGACFPPDLGDGKVACGLNDECPPSYGCHNDDRKCWKLRGAGGGDLAMSPPSTDMAGADLASVVDLASSDLADCPTKLVCEAKDCGTTPDGCGGIMSCGNGCPMLQMCGGGGMANVCGVGVCMPKSCVKHVDCGIISNGCDATLDCGGCTGNAYCGGGGPNLCG